MIYIFEGMDNCLKDTIIYELRSILPAETQVMKFSNPPKKVDALDYQRRHFADMFEMMSATVHEARRNLILNRAHLGEFVYGPIYRKHEADWIFDLEQKYFQSHQNVEQSFLFLLYDRDNKKLKQREDGRSFSELNDLRMNEERTRFLQAFNKSHFKHKVKFDLSDYLRPSVDLKNEIDIDTILKVIVTMTGLKHI